MSRKTYDRDDALGAAMQAFWRSGYHGTSVSDLCAATGLNRKTLYAEFGGKDALYTEAVRRYTGGALVQTEAALTAKPLGRENVRRYVRAMRYEPDCRGCLMTMTVNERALVPPASVEAVAETLARIEDLIRQNLRADGIGEAESARLATFLVFCIQGITTMGKLEGDNARLAATVDTALSVLDRA